MIRNWINIRRQNSNALRKVADCIAKEFEVLSYAALSDPSQPLSYKKIIDGIEVHWTVDVIRRRPNGDIMVEMNFYSTAPTFWGKPSHVFWMRKDGSLIDSTSN